MPPQRKFDIPREGGLRGKIKLQGLLLKKIEILEESRDHFSNILHGGHGYFLKPDIAGALYLLCYFLKNLFDIWSTYNPTVKLRNFDQKYCTAWVACGLILYVFTAILIKKNNYTSIISSSSSMVSTTLLKVTFRMDGKHSCNFLKKLSLTFLTPLS